ncbi:hypothetical protein GCM10027517_03880 [Phycicoccus ginsengisoli]
MPTIRDSWARYEASTAKASDQARVLALAGIAAVWLFTKTDKGDLSAVKGTPKGFIFAGILFAFAIAFDVLQYSVGSEVLRRWIRSREKKGGDPSESVEAPDRVALVPRVFYWGKIGLVFVGYLAFGITVWAALLA